MTAAVATLVIGLVVGYLAQRSRMCFIGGIRDFLLIRDTALLKGLVAFALTAWVGIPLARLAAGATPVGPADALDLAALSLTVAGGFGVGYVSTLANGCPLRQHVLAAQGVKSSIAYVAGFLSGALVVDLAVGRLVVFLLP